MHVVVEANPEAAALRTADILTGHIEAAASTIDIGLAGGSTPRAVYRELRRRDLPWERVWCWLPDERWVPPDHPDANALMVRSELVDHVPVGFDAPDTTMSDPHRAAADYENRIVPRFVRGGAIAPEVVFLGMGADGHTASLFPGTAALDVDRFGYVANWVPAFESWRLTATSTLLRAARTIVFLVTGQTKAPALREILEGDAILPARIVADGAGETTWVLDEAAASLLT